MLKIAKYQIEESELDNDWNTHGILPKEQAPLREIIKHLSKTYCNKIGIEFTHTENPELKEWLQKKIEIESSPQGIKLETKQKIFQLLNKAEIFEKFLQTKYAGQRRFSLEGAETLIPLISTIIDSGTDSGGNRFVLGMAHRGRLNVLANILNKAYIDIFNQFEEHYAPDFFQGSGDLKYHKGFQAEIFAGKKDKKVHVLLCNNTSHLEAIDTVVLGNVKALQDKYLDRKKSKTIPIIIHGDAALSGQGIVYESLQLNNLKGYDTGGTIHIVINNQIGFTTIPAEGRSTNYCTDIAHTFKAPIFHVNGEEPEDCVYVAMLAMEIRAKFGCDVFIDLNVYRRWGHTENDEPSFTQPLEYKLIRDKKSIRELYHEKLLQQGVVEKYMADQLEEDFKETLQRALKGGRSFKTDGIDQSHLPKSREEILECKKNILHNFESSFSSSKLKTLAKKLCETPSNFNIHPRLKAIIEKRFSMITAPETAIDWAMAENLAFASLLSENISIRLSGEDCRRGTFSQRHATWYDQKTGESFSPLKHIQQDQGYFTVLDSPLSEYGVLGFEYGYNVINNDDLVIWEAQFGDFANGAQIIIDQFIAAGEQKWGIVSNLVMLLPHGYEGQGAEHSSARIERFLKLCGNYNIQVTYPTSPAQYFHLLRRQALRKIKKPLIVMTPKGMLRNNLCFSTLQDLSKGHFQEVIDDKVKHNKISRVIFCTGKIYYELMEERKKRNNIDVSIISIEQLYPLANDNIADIIKKYKNCKDFYWLQEEPRNMGAWEYISSKIKRLLPKTCTLKYIGRPRGASPATGSFAIHKKDQNAIIQKAFENTNKENLLISKTIRG